MKKKLIIFEGLGGSGKTTLIRYVKHDLSHLYSIDILDKYHPSSAEILLEGSPKILFNMGHKAFFIFRWTRLFLYINYILSSDSNLFLMDRGFLTSYIHSMNDGIDQDFLMSMLEEQMGVISDVDVRYVYLECDMEIANRRLVSKVGVDLENKISRNLAFERYYANVRNIDFVKDLIIINTSESLFCEYDKLINYIRS